MTFVAGTKLGRYETRSKIGAGGMGEVYGYLWWLNTKREQYPSAPATSFAALGYGSNTIWINPTHDLVVVGRWHQDRSADELFKRILATIKTNQGIGSIARP